MKTIYEMCKETKVCVIMRNVSLEDTIDYAKAAFDGGIRMFEVAMNSAGSAKQIAMLREYFGGRAYVGAGTVTTIARCEAAQKAGAQFFLTPSVAIETLQFCKEHNIPLLPGVMTPTDVGICVEYGFMTMKLFPAGELPMHYIKSLKGPFDGTEFVAVGGVTPENASEFLQNGFIGIGIGTQLFKKEYVAQKKWDKATEEIQKLLENINGSVK